MLRGGPSIKSLRAAEQDRPDVAKAREEWRENQPKLDAGRLIFIDETWTKGPTPRRMPSSREDR
jgi:hypothetical protein